MTHRSLLSIKSAVLVRLGKEVGENTTKMPSNRESLRLVVQHVRESSSSRYSYRLIGYGDEHTYQPVNFDSLDDLLKRFKEAFPDFDVSCFSEGKQSGSSILFADVFELSEAQRSILGLRK